MISLERLIQDYGYIALLVGTLLEGEVILIIAGFAAHRGYLKLPWVIATAFSGAFLGDQISFFMGRWKGAPFLEKRPGWKLRADRVQALLSRYQTLLALGFRFAYGFRIVTPFVLGMSGIETARFFLLNALAVTIWATLVGTGGYLFGAALEVFVAHLKRYEHAAMAAIAVAGVVVWAYKYYRHRQAAKR